MALQNIRSNTASKRPLASGLSDGQIAVNTNETSPGLFFKGASGAVLKVGPVHVGTSAPNSSPATGGSTGNSVGEQWLDTSNSGFVFKIWDGTAWRSETGEFVDVTGDTMTGDLTISGADLVMDNGEIIAATGAEATPSITFDGDLDTGFYKPAADKLAISTGGTSRVIIDDSGRVGIGITDPEGTLHLQGSNAQVRLTPTNDTTQTARIVFTSSDRSTVSTISSGGLLGQDINFRTNADRMRITSDGNVGIGTSSPTSLLHLSSTSAEIIQTFTTSTGTVKIYANNDDFVFDADQYRFRNEDRTTEYVRINNLGNVGIGTSAPSALLHVSDASAKIRIGADASNAYTDIFRDVTTGRTVYNAAQAAPFRGHVWQLGGSEAARIDNTGRLLVGTSSALTTANSITPKFQISSTASDASISITRFAGVSSSGGTISLTKTRSSSQGTFSAVSNDDDLGILIFNGDDGAAYRSGAWIRAQADGNWASGDAPGRLIFSTTADGASSPTERIVIRSDGRQRNFSSSATVFEAASSQTANASNFIFIGKYGATAIGSGSNAFFVFTNGNVQNINNSYGAISDIKLKENIVEANSQWDDLKALQVRNYNFKEGQTHTQIGLVAQEVELVSPGLVSESPDRDDEGNDLGTVTKSVNYSVLYMKAVKALQEAMERIETLEQRLTDAGL